MGNDRYSIEVVAPRRAGAWAGGGGAGRGGTSSFITSTD